MSETPQVWNEYHLHEFVRLAAAEAPGPRWDWLRGLEARFLYICIKGALRRSQRWAGR